MSEKVTFEEAKAILKSTAIYDHLAEVLLKVLVEKPQNASDSFEHLSNIVKQKSMTASQEKKNITRSS